MLPINTPFPHPGEPPDPLRVFTARGLTIPAFAEVDNAVHQFMMQMDQNVSLPFTWGGGGNGTLNGPVTSVVLAVAQGGRLVYSRGYTYDKPNSELTQPASLMRVASVSKTITSMSVFQLKIDLNTSIDSILGLSDTPGAGTKTPNGPPPWLATATYMQGPGKDALARWKSIKAWHLLSMTSGIWSDVFGYMKEIASDLSPADESLDPATIDRWQVARWLKWDCGNPKQMGPGVSCNYQNSNFLLLSCLVEKLGGVEFEHYVKRNIFHPLGLRRPRHAGDTQADRHPDEVDYPDWAATKQSLNFQTNLGFGGWLMSAPDYVRAVSSLRHAAPVKVLDDTSRIAMWTVSGNIKSIDGGSDAFYGLGWGTNTAQYQPGPPVLRKGHGGDLPHCALTQGMVLAPDSPDAAPRSIAHEPVSIFLGINNLYDTNNGMHFRYTPLGATDPLPDLVDIFSTVESAIWNALSSSPPIAHDLFPTVDIPDFACAVSSASFDQSHFAVRGTDDHLWTVGTSGDWKDHGGILTSPPFGNVDVGGLFARGSDGQIWKFDGTAFSLYGIGKVRCTPAIADDGSMAAIDSQGFLITLAGTDPEPRSWVRQNAVFSCALAVISGPEGLLVFGLGLDFAVYQWSGKPGVSGGSVTPLGGMLFSPPSVVSPSPGHYDVLALGGDRRLYWQHQDPSSTWGAWQQVGGPTILASRPVAVSLAPGSITVVALDETRRALMLHHDAVNGWGTWTDTGGLLTSLPTLRAIPSAALPTVGVAAGTGADGALWYKKFNDGPPTAGGWISLGGEIG